MLNSCPFHLFRNKKLLLLDYGKYITGNGDDVALTFENCDYTLILSNTFLIPFIKNIYLRRLPNWHQAIGIWRTNFLNKIFRKVSDFDEMNISIQFDGDLMLLANRYFIEIYDKKNLLLFTSKCFATIPLCTSTALV